MVGDTVEVFDFTRGRIFRVVIYDLLGEQVDAIVNAANGNLSHGGGVAAAIADAAGEQLEREGRQIIERRGPLKAGEAVITTAGRLPFKGVIHAIGPRMGEGNEKEKIIRALKSAFELAQAQGWQSLSFPGISSGIFAVPYDICADAYFAAVKQFFDKHRESSLKNIRLCLFDGPLLKTIYTKLAGWHEELNRGAARCPHLTADKGGAVCTNCGLIGCSLCVQLFAAAGSGRSGADCPPGFVDVSNTIFHYLCEKCARELAKGNG